MQPVMPNPAVAKHKVYDAACGLRTADDVVLLDRTRDLTEGGQILSAPGHAGRPRGLYRVYIGRPPRGSREHETGLYNEIHVTRTCYLLGPVWQGSGFSKNSFDSGFSEEVAPLKELKSF